MALLFDTFPDEPKKGRRKSNAAAEPPSVLPPVFRPLPVVPKTLGQTEDIHTCPDDRCGRTFHDITDEDRGFWRLECVSCGTGQWVRVIRGLLKPKEATFVFPSGDYAGMEIEAVWGDDRGRAYVEWAALEHKVEAVRDACKTYLDAQKAAP